MNDTIKILNDERPIRCLVEEGASIAQVGQLGVTKIEAYGEPGEYCFIPFFAVYKDDKIFFRVNGLKVYQIFYFD